MKWIEALKKFNAGKGEWCVPRKGTREHKEVLSIMQGATLYTLSLAQNRLGGKKGLKQTQLHLDRDAHRQFSESGDIYFCESCESLA